jgi:hypothetical protein
MGRSLTGFEPVGMGFSKEASSFQVSAYFEKQKLLVPYELSHDAVWCSGMLRCVMHDLKKILTLSSYLVPSSVKFGRS